MIKKGKLKISTFILMAAYKPREVTSHLGSKLTLEAFSD